MYSCGKKAELCQQLLCAITKPGAGKTLLLAPACERLTNDTWCVWLVEILSRRVCQTAAAQAPPRGSRGSRQAKTRELSQQENVLQSYSLV